MKASPFAHASDETLREGDYVRTRNADDQAVVDKKVAAMERMSRYLPHLHNKTLTVQQQQQQRREADVAKRQQYTVGRKRPSTQFAPDGHEEIGSHSNDDKDSPTTQLRTKSTKRVSIVLKEQQDPTVGSEAFDGHQNQRRGSSPTRPSSRPNTPLQQHRPSSSTSISPLSTNNNNKRLSTGSVPSDSGYVGGRLSPSLANGGTSTASRMGIDMSSLESCWGTLTDGTWLSSKRRPTYVGSVLAVNIQEKTVLVSIWKKDDTFYTQEKRPLRAIPFSEVEKIPPSVFNEICKKKYLRQSAQQSLMGQDHMDGATPFALLEFNNKVVAGILDRANFATQNTNTSLQSLPSDSVHQQNKSGGKPSSVGGNDSNRTTDPSFLPPRPQSMLDRVLGGVGVGGKTPLGASSVKIPSRATTPLGLKSNDEGEIADPTLFGPQRLVDRSSRSMNSRITLGGSNLLREAVEQDENGKAGLIVQEQSRPPSVVSASFNSIHTSSRPPTRSELLSRGIITAVAVTTIKGKRVGEALFAGTGQHGSTNTNTGLSPVGSNGATTNSDPRLGLVLRKLAKANYHNEFQKQSAEMDMRFMDKDQQHQYYTAKAATSNLLPDTNPKNSTKNRGPSGSVMKTGLSGQFIGRGRGAILNDPIPVIKPIHDQLEMVRPLAKELRQAGIKIKSAPRTPFYELESERLASQLVVSNEASHTKSRLGEQEVSSKRELRQMHTNSAPEAEVQKGMFSFSVHPGLLSASVQEKTKEGRPLSVDLSEKTSPRHNESIDDSVMGSIHVLKTIAGRPEHTQSAGLARKRGIASASVSATFKETQSATSVTNDGAASSTSHVTIPRAFLMSTSTSNITSPLATSRAAQQIPPPALVIQPPAQFNGSYPQAPSSVPLSAMLGHEASGAPPTSLFGLDPTSLIMVHSESIVESSVQSISNRKHRKGKNEKSNNHLSVSPSSPLAASYNSGSRSPMTKALEASRREADAYMLAKERDGAVHQRQLLGMTDGSTLVDGSDLNGTNTDLIVLPHIPSEAQMKRSYSSHSGAALGGTTSSLRSGSPLSGSYHSMLHLRGKSSPSLRAAAAAVAETVSASHMEGKQGSQKWYESQGDPIQFIISSFGKYKRNEKWLRATSPTSPNASNKKLITAQHPPVVPPPFVASAGDTFVSKWWWSGQPTAIKRSAALYPIFGPTHQYFQRVGINYSGPHRNNSHKKLKPKSLEEGEQGDHLIRSFSSDNNSSHGEDDSEGGLVHNYAARDFAPKNRRSTLGPSGKELSEYNGGGDNNKKKDITDSPQDPLGPINAKMVESSTESSPMTTRPNSRPPSGLPTNKARVVTATGSPHVVPPKRFEGNASMEGSSKKVLEKSEEEEVKPLTRFAGIVADNELPQQQVPSPTVNIHVSHSSTAKRAVDIAEKGTGKSTNEASPTTPRLPNFTVMEAEREDYAVSGLPCVLRAVIATGATEAVVEQLNMGGGLPNTETANFASSLPSAFADSALAASVNCGLATGSASTSPANPHLGKLAELGPTPMLVLQFKPYNESAHTSRNKIDRSKISRASSPDGGSDTDSFGDHLTPREREKSVDRKLGAPTSQVTVNSETQLGPILPSKLAFVSLWQPPPLASSSPQSLAAKGRRDSVVINRTISVSTATTQQNYTAALDNPIVPILSSTPHESVLETSVMTEEDGHSGGGKSAAQTSLPPIGTHGGYPSMIGTNNRFLSINNNPSHLNVGNGGGGGGGGLNTNGLASSVLGGTMSVGGHNLSLSASPQLAAMFAINDRWNAVMSRFFMKQCDDNQSSASHLRAVTVGVADLATGLPQVIVVADDTLRNFAESHFLYRQKLKEFEECQRRSTISVLNESNDSSASLNKKSYKSISAQSFKDMRLALLHQTKKESSNQAPPQPAATANLSSQATNPNLAKCPPTPPSLLTPPQHKLSLSSRNPSAHLTLQEELVAEGLAWVLLPGALLAALEALREWSALVAKVKSKRRKSNTNKRNKQVVVAIDTTTANIGRKKALLEGVGDTIVSDEDDDQEDETVSSPRSSAYTAAAAETLSTALSALSVEERRLFHTYGHYLNTLLALQQNAMKAREGMWDQRYGIGGLVQHHTQLSAVVAEARQQQKQPSISNNNSATASGISGAVSSQPSLLMRTRSSLGAAASLGRTTSISISAVSGGSAQLPATNSLPFARRQSIGNFSSINASPNMSTANSQAASAAVAATAQLAVAVTASLFGSSGLPPTNVSSSGVTPTQSYGTSSAPNERNQQQRRMPSPTTTDVTTAAGTGGTYPDEGRPMGALFDLWESTQAALKGAS